MYVKAVIMERDLTDNASLRDLKQPVALYFSYVDADRYDFYRQNKEQLRDIQSTCRDELIEYLKKWDYPVCSNLSTLAAHPASIVVSTRGIQTPFLEAKDAKSFAQDLIGYIDASKFAKPLSYVLAVHLEQMSMPVLHPQSEPGMFQFTRHPDGRMLDFIKDTYGPDFIQNKFKQALTYSEDAEPLLKKKFDVFNMEEEIYSGRQLVLEAYTIHAYNDLESRYLNYGTLDYAHAAHFVKDKAFIHHYAKAKDQEYYDDFGIESGGGKQTDYHKQVETIVLPHKNKHTGVEIYMNHEKRRFMVPMEDAEWQAFAEFFRAAYIPQNDNLKQRRINILREAKENGGVARTYMPVGYTAENLLLDEYEKQKPPIMEDLIPTGLSNTQRKFFIDWTHSMIDKARKIKKNNIKDGNKSVEHETTISYIDKYSKSEQIK